MGRKSDQKSDYRRLFSNRSPAIVRQDSQDLRFGRLRLNCGRTQRRCLRHVLSRRRLSRLRMDFRQRHFRGFRQEHRPRRHGMKSRIFQRCGHGFGGFGRGFCCNRPAATRPVLRAAPQQPGCQEATGKASGYGTDRPGMHSIRLGKGGTSNRTHDPHSKRIGAAAAGTLGIIGKVCLGYRVAPGPMPGEPTSVDTPTGTAPMIVLNL